MDARDTMRAISLAARRYPDVPPGVAYLFFSSDRQRAGAGALRQFSRGRGDVQCTKVRLWEHPIVLYTRRIVRPERMEFPPMEHVFPSLDVAPCETVTLIKVPAVNRVHAINIDAELFHSEMGRKIVAAKLRQLRKAK